MTIEEMIKALEAAIDDLGAVLSDLRDVRDGDMGREDVNRAYLLQGIRCAQEAASALAA